MDIAEKYLNENKNTKLSYKFGFLGIGMGGSSIAAVGGNVEMMNSYPYKAVLINSTPQDADRIKINNSETKKILIGDGRGAARNIEQGKKLFTDNLDYIEENIRTNFSDTDFVWLCAGLGGGTGTGGLVETIGALMRNGFHKKFGLIITLPRNIEGKQTIQNALERLQEIEGAMRGLGSIIVVDNQKLFEEFSNKYGTKTTQQYLNFTNNYVVDTIHSLNTVTASYEPFSEFHFDASEFGTLIKTPGILHLVKFSINTPQTKNKNAIDFIETIKQNINKGYLSTGFNLKQSKRYALSILSHEDHAKTVHSLDTLTGLEELLRELAPLCNDRAISQYTYNLPEDVEKNESSKKNSYIYALFAGLNLPKRVSELITELENIEKAQQDALLEDSSSMFGDFKKNTKKTEEITNGADAFAALFGSSNETESETVDLFKNFKK